MYILRFRTFLISIDFLFLLIIPVTIVTGVIEEFLIAFFSILLHELSHILVAALMGFKAYCIRILPVGLNASIDYGAGSIYKRVLVHLSGPVANIAVFVSLSVVSAYNYITLSERVSFLISINAYLAAFNLLPVLPLDGGRAINEIVAGWVGFFQAGKCVRRISFLFSILLIILGLMQLVGKHRNFSILIIGIYIFFILKSDEGSEALMTIKHIFYRRARLIKKGMYPARVLVAMKSSTLGEILKNLDFDRFHLIHVLDSDLKLVKVLTEQEIIEGMLNFGTELSVEEYLNKIDTGRK